MSSDRLESYIGRCYLTTDNSTSCRVGYPSVSLAFCLYCLQITC